MKYFHYQLCASDNIKNELKGVFFFSQNHKFIGIIVVTGV